MLCSHVDVSFNSICLNVLKGIKQFTCECGPRKTDKKHRFKGDTVKALIKTSYCEKLVLYLSEKVQKSAAFAMLFWFLVTKQSLENGLGFPQ